MRPSSDLQRVRLAMAFVLATSLVLTVTPTARAQESLAPGPERAVTDPFYQRSFPASTNAAVATGGDRSLIVWAEERLHGDGIFATLVTESAEVLTPGSIAVARGPLGNPAVAFDGDHYLVVWENLTTGGVRAARLDADGKLLDPTGFGIAGEGARNPAVAWGDGVFLVVFDQGSEVRAARVVGNAAVAGETFALGPAIGLGMAFGLIAAPDVAFAQEDFLAVWASCDFPSASCFVNVYGTRVAPSGEVRDAPRLAIATPHEMLTEPAVSPEGDGWVVVWDRNGLQNSSIQGLRVEPSGESGETFEISRRSTGEVAEPDVAENSDGLVAVWQEGSQILSGSIDLARRGVPGITSVSGMSMVAAAAALAPSGPGFLAVWHDRPMGPEKDADVFAVELGAFGEPRDLPEGEISLGANEQIHGAIARGDNVYLAAWQDYRRRSGAELFAGRLSSEGEPLDGTGFSLAMGDGRRPAIAWGMGVFLVVSERHGPSGVDLVATRVTEQGMVLDPGGIPLTVEGNNQEPSVVFNGEDFAVVWVRKRAGGIRFTRVTPTGTVRDPGGALVAFGRGPVIAFNGKDHLIAYAHFRLGIEALVFNRDEEPTVAQPIPLTSQDIRRFNPAVAAAPGGRFLIVWEQCSGPCSQTDLYAGQVTGAGTVLDFDGNVLAATGAHETNSAVAWNGNEYVVVWQHCLPLELCVPQPPLARPRIVDPIFGARVSVDGTVLDPNGLLLTEADKWNRPPALASAGDGTTALIYQRTAPEPPYGDTARIFLRLLGIK